MKYFLYEVNFNHQFFQPPIVGIVVLSEFKLVVPQKNFHNTINLVHVLFSLKFCGEIVKKKKIVFKISLKRNYLKVI